MYYIPGYPLHREKQGKWPKRFPVRENREFGNFAKTQGIWFAQVINSLILKVKYISKEDSAQKPNFEGKYDFSAHR